MGGDSCQCSLRSNLNFLRFAVNMISSLCMKPELMFLVLLFRQMYQHLKKIQLETVIRLKSYCFGRQQLQNYTIFANESVILFVSGNVVANHYFLYIVLVM